MTQRADRMFMHHHASNIFLTNAPMRAETKTDAEGLCYFSSGIHHCSAGESEKVSSPAAVPQSRNAQKYLER